jgi:hypothetical protein
VNLYGQSFFVRNKKPYCRAHIVPPFVPGFVPHPLPLHEQNRQAMKMAPLRFPTSKRTICFTHTTTGSLHTQQQTQQQTQSVNEADSNRIKEKEAHEKKHNEKEERGMRGANLPGGVHKRHHHHGMHWKSFSPPQINQGFSAL